MISQFFKFLSGYIVVTAQEDSKGNILLQHQEQQPEQEIVDQKTKSE